MVNAVITLSPEGGKPGGWPVSPSFTRGGTCEQISSHGEWLAVVLAGLPCCSVLASASSKLAAVLQGIDLKAGGRNKKTARTAPKSDNVYLKLLVKVGAT